MRKPTIYKLGQPLKKQGWSSWISKIIAYTLIAMLVIAIGSRLGVFMIDGLKTFIDVVRAAF